MFNKILFATLLVSDQDQAINFYTSHFGFEKMVDNPGPEGRFLLIGYKNQGWPVLLWPGKARRAESEEDRTGVIFLQSDDLRKDFAALKERGIEFIESEPEEYAWGVRATALDPDGNRISLRQLSIGVRG